MCEEEETTTYYKWTNYDDMKENQKFQTESVILSLLLIQIAFHVLMSSIIRDTCQDLLKYIFISSLPNEPHGCDEDTFDVLFSHCIVGYGANVI